MHTPEMVTVNLYWLWAVCGAALVFALAGCGFGLAALTRLRAERATHRQQINRLERQFAALRSGALGVGEKLVGVEHRLVRTAERQAELEHRDPGQLPYRQAARLVGMGASVDDLVGDCGLSRAEAELLTLLQGRVAARDVQAANG